MRTFHRLPRTLAITIPLTAIVATSACATSASDETATTSTPVAAAAAPAPIDGAANGVVTQNRLGIAPAQAAAQAALARCQADGLGSVTVSVVDRAGNVQAMLRGDNAAQHTVEAARQKAYTAAAFGANTSDLSERAKGDGATVADLPGTLFLAGGVSVKSAGASIAGIGVGGAPDGMKDQACAAAGLDAIAGALG
ncbi:heme-binding protein [Rhodococcus opacus]|nr:heme-binding protein [Rhodococcus opacus]RZL74480.1 MAG: heme-binding protein [Rhodococcus sp. (in: high G+C Gram-positive bacteria)]